MQDSAFRYIMMDIVKCQMVGNKAMHAEKDDQAQRQREHAEKTAFVERARELLKGYDLMDAAQLKQARALLEQQGIPQWIIFACAPVPETSEAGMRWAEQRLQEMRDSGELP